MIKIFIDSDIILDLLLKRNKYEDAAKLITKIVDNQFIGYTTPIVIANIHYIMTKLENKTKSIENIKKLRKIISLLTVDEKIIDATLELGATDFEDSIQFITAEKNKLDFIITRNKRDYKQSKIHVLDAEEFLFLDSKIGVKLNNNKRI